MVTFRLSMTFKKWLESPCFVEIIRKRGGLSTTFNGNGKNVVETQMRFVEIIEKKGGLSDFHDFHPL